MFDNFAPDEYKNNPARTEWAVETLKKAAIASRRLGLNAHTHSLVHYYGTPPSLTKAEGLVEMGVQELAKRWLPILNTFDEQGVDVCCEIHPGKIFMTG